MCLFADFRLKAEATRGTPRFGGFRLQAEVTRRLAIAAAVVVSVGCAAGCGDAVSGSRCSSLVYGESGPSRSEYLPCAGEMIAAIDELEPRSRDAMKGDKQARSAGRASLGRLIGLMKAAGGLKMLDRWQDRALTDLNLNIHNAATKYQAFYMTPILEEPNPFAAQSREAAASELSAATSRSESARSLYRSLGGR